MRHFAFGRTDACRSRAFMAAGIRLRSVLVAFAIGGAAIAQSTAAEPQSFKPSTSVVYKVADVGPKAKDKGPAKLRLHIFQPAGNQPENRQPAIVFFFGGGWVGGDPSQFYPHCAHLAERGMVAISAEYRIAGKHDTTPFECVADGKSAMRWVRAHANELGIDPDRIAAGGGSAGGQVAAATSALPKFNEPGEDTSISAIPNALVLFNPVFDNGPQGYGYDRIGDQYEDFSPMHNIRHGMPPTIVMLGTEDKLVPVDTARKFQQRMEGLGSRSDLKLYEGAGHGFFNYRNRENYDATVADMDGFLESIGYISKPR